MRCRGSRIRFLPNEVRVSTKLCLLRSHRIHKLVLEMEPQNTADRTGRIN